MSVLSALIKIIYENENYVKYVEICLTGKKITGITSTKKKQNLLHFPWEMKFNYTFKHEDICLIYAFFFPFQLMIG